MKLRFVRAAVALVALAAIGCSDAPPRPAKIGLQIALRNPDPTLPAASGKTCPTTGTTWDIGKAVYANACRNSSGTATGCSVAATQQACAMITGCVWGRTITRVDSPTPTVVGTTLEDGTGNASIDCVVRKNGQFEADGSGLDPLITVPNGSINFTLGGTASKSGTPQTNQAQAALNTPLTLAVNWNPGLPECTFTAIHEQDAGALWADFDCPVLSDTSRPNVACRASGTIVLEYCSTGQEE